ncbi:hypothetical protein B0H15DRAFT_923266 [Mycena belliarum]|uniref:Glutamine synthetase n=1 Tax=Mycena belliarum TaxID=1033014 RepID=A0AAD6U150_9AGAR|nr:hypothetical protein B0H15DRAFT_923266 [Mycena belliae]
MDYSHGVVYTPRSVQSRKGDGSSIDLNAPGISYVRIYWVDLVNIRRCRIVPIEYFNALLKSNRPGINVAKAALGMVYLMIAPGFSSIGEYLYVIDLASLKPCPFAPGHLAVLGQFEEKAAIPGADGNLSVKVDLCARTLLRRIIEEIKQVQDTEFLVGFESEFILLKSTDPIEPVSIHDFAASSGLLAGSTQAVVLQEVADAIRASGIALEMFHTEAAPGQYEVVTGPLGPMEAADALIHTREIIVQTAAKHGLHATFAPRPFMSSTGSSAHAHISVHSSAAHKTPGVLSKHEAAFLAGVLDHLPGIAALTLPAPASYKRVADGAWSGGTYVCYGTENREAPIRLTNAASPASRNFETRCIDGAANPHVALAGIFAGGLLGLRTMMALEVQDCPGPRTAAEMTEAERRALGITKRMPLSVNEARANLRADAALCEVLSEGFVEGYLAVNKILEAALEQDESETQRLTRLVKFY